MNADEVADAEQVFGLPAIAEITAEFYKLKAERKRLERIEESFKTILRQHIEQSGEPIQIEGIPALRLVPVTTPYYDLTGLKPAEWSVLIAANTDMIFSGEDGFLRVHDGQYKLARQRGLDVEIKAIRGRRTSMLRFDSEEER